MSCGITGDKATTATSNPLTTLERKVADLEQAYANLSAAQSGVTRAQIDSINSQIAAINGTISGLQSQIASPNARLSKVESDIAALQSLITSVATINAKLVTIESKLATITPVDISALQTAVTALQASLATLQAKVTAQDAKIAALQVIVDGLVAPPTTTTPPPTTIPITAADAIECSVTTLPAEMDILADTVTTYYLTLKYTNTAAQAFTNVKFKLTLYTTAGNFVTIAQTSILPTTPVWVKVGGSGATWFLQTLTGISVPANSNGELIIKLDVKCSAAGVIMALANVAGSV
jgi:uncharacterized coiled-coil protein SlyX